MMDTVIAQSLTDSFRADLDALTDEALQSMADETQDQIDELEGWLEALLAEKFLRAEA